MAINIYTNLQRNPRTTELSYSNKLNTETTLTTDLSLSLCLT